MGNILYVPGLTKNSVGSITDKGLIIHFSPHECHVIDKQSNMILLKGVWDSMNSLYRIDDYVFVNCIEININNTH